MIPVLHNLKLMKLKPSWIAYWNKSRQTQAKPGKAAYWVIRIKVWLVVEFAKHSNRLSGMLPNKTQQ